MDMANDANKRYKVMSIIDRSEVENLPVTEEALDLEAMNALATEKKQDAEISYLRQNDSYEVWSNADRIEYMKKTSQREALDDTLGGDRESTFGRARVQHVEDAGILRCDGQPDGAESDSHDSS